MAIFIDSFELINENLPKDDRLDIRLGWIENQRRMTALLANFNQPYGDSAVFKQKLLKDLSAHFITEEKFKAYIDYYIEQRLTVHVDGALLDKAFNQTEFENIRELTQDLGLSGSDLFSRLHQLVIDKKGDWEVDDPSEARQQSPPNQQANNQSPPNKSKSASDKSSTVITLSPIAMANVASGIAVSIAVLYLLLVKGGIFLAGWFGPLLFIVAAFISVKNASDSPKRHSWGIVAAIIMYFSNYSMFLILLPVFAIWHWSPVIISSFPNKSNLVWMLPVILCVGVYGSAEAVQRVPRQQTNRRPQPVETRPVPNRPKAKQPQAKKPQQRKPRVKSPTQNRTTSKAPAITKARNPKSNTSTGNTGTSVASAALTNDYRFVCDSIEVELFATSGPASTGIRINQGDSLAIYVLDETRIEWSDSESDVGPKGASFLARTRTDGSSFLCADAHCGSVIGRIGEGTQWFEIGAGAFLVAKHGGILYLSINDLEDSFDDNFGMFDVQIRHAKRKTR